MYRQEKLKWQPTECGNDFLYFWFVSLSLHCTAYTSLVIGSIESSFKIWIVSIYLRTSAVA